MEQADAEPIHLRIMITDKKNYSYNPQLVAVLAGTVFYILTCQFSVLFKYNNL